MTRIEFTNKIAHLIIEMIEQGERPIIDWVKRSDEEQRRMFDKGLSDCDGTNEISMHQLGKAMDIYFVSKVNNRLVEPDLGYKYWHDRWIEMGGDPIIKWDLGHFE